MTRDDTTRQLAARLRQSIDTQELVTYQYIQGLVEEELATRLYRCRQIPEIHKIIRTPGNVMMGWSKGRVSWFAQGHEMKEFPSPVALLEYLETTLEEAP